MRPTRAVVEEWLTRIIYKPGHEFIVGVDRDYYAVTDHYLVWVRVERMAPDFRDPDSTILLVQHGFVPSSITTFEMFHCWLYTLVTSSEIHEINEWWRVDGELIYDPHKEATFEMSPRLDSTDN